MVEVTGRTFIGTEKSVNQDAYAVLSATASFGDAALAVVCDGVGGLASGEQASSAVVRELVHWFESEFPAYAVDNLFSGRVDLEGVEAAWGTLLGDLNRRMWRYGERLNVRMGTTCTALLLCSGRFAVCHVGDCRVYRALAAGGVKRITRDQTFIQREVDAGRISARDALRHPKGSVIMQAVGAQEGIAPVFSFGEYGPGDLFLVCCDGLYRRLGDDRMGLHLAGAARAEGPDGLLAALEAMIARAVDAGEKDNITGVLIRPCPSSGGVLFDHCRLLPTIGDDEVTAAPVTCGAFESADDEATDRLAVGGAS